MKVFLKLFMFLFLLSINAIAQPAQQLVQVQVAPDRADLLYKEGDKVKFNISILKNSIPLTDVEIKYSVSEDMMTPHLTKSIVLKNGVGTIEAGSMKKAGFLRCQVWATYQGKSYYGLSTVGFSPEKIEPVTQLPNDFTSYWDKAIADASKLAMDVKMSLVPEKCTSSYNMYKVSIQNMRHGSRIYGMLSIPTGEGKFPAILRVPGAGVRPYKGDVSNASKGYIIFEIGIHGVPVDLDPEVYASLSEGALKNYHSANLDSRDDYYYKRVYLGCVRSIDFLFTLPEFDGKNMITYGGSQGGALSIVTAALDKRVTGLVAFYPALSDMVGSLHGRAGGWPRMFENKDNNTPKRVTTAQYYDVVNFARQLQVPGYYALGYNDMVCPPTSMYAALNSIKAPKEIKVSEDTGHYVYAEQWAYSWQWIKQLLEK